MNTKEFLEQNEYAESVRGITVEKPAFVSGMALLAIAFELAKLTKAILSLKSDLMHEIKITGIKTRN